ncbi:substrate-binding domain-containing protein (plasmid) [Hymenobacter tibetensis]|uniref:Substrate-binding domain-containing protein n=1 Tax=Hymenobacter tibetensis TaxID=497967 RepID=A0ABY4D527_9BACT|nr:substrate-binding domain-containing protein [Hymenobacter tibetensis]UOG77386.1 substrate-binding domain-containing protein [Hymenobacter tibetensis]
MDRAARIKDIALQAQVSVGTVDRVLHSRGRVADEVRLRILKITKDLDYKPNLSARALATDKTYRIAALIPDPAVDAYWQAPQDGVEKAGAELAHYGVIITQFTFDPFNHNSFSALAQQVSSSEYDGILVAPIFPQHSLSYFKKWKRAGIPFVLFHTQIPDFEPLVYIGQDSYQSGLLAGKILHFGNQEAGSMVVAHIGESSQSSSHLLHREQGFRDYFTRNNLVNRYPIQALSFQPSSPAPVTEQLREMFESTPGLTGIFVTTSKAYVVADYLQQNPGPKINLIGYDLIESNLRCLETGSIQFLINQNPKGQGYWGIHALADHLVFHKKNKPTKYLPLDVITRENLQYYMECLVFK